MPILPKRYRKHLPDIGNKETEILLGDLIAEIEKVYGQAHDELQKKADDYLLQFTEMDKKKREQWEKGEITKQEYQNWRKNKILTGQRWRTMSQTMADNLANSNGIAASIINGYIPTAYLLFCIWCIIHRHYHQQASEHWSSEAYLLLQACLSSKLHLHC